MADRPDSEETDRANDEGSAEGNWLDPRSYKRTHAFFRVLGLEVDPTMPAASPPSPTDAGAPPSPPATVVSPVAGSPAASSRVVAQTPRT
jgi:hypothetical protein